MSERDAFNQDIEIKGMNFKVFFCSLSVEFIHKKNVEAALGSFLNSSSTFFVCVCKVLKNFFHRFRFWIIHDDASTQSLKLDVTKNENKNFVYVQIFFISFNFSNASLSYFFSTKEILWTFRNRRERLSMSVWKYFLLCNLCLCHA